jgi:methionyl aminopeptidase
MRSGPNDPCWCNSGAKYKKCHRDADEGIVRGVVRPVRPGRVSPKRAVPPSILRPDYAESGRPARKGEPAIKAPDVIERLRRACRAAAEVLEAVGAAVKPGVTTDALDALCHDEYLKRGGYPSTLNYHGYPKSLCTSVNEVICHGIPDDRPLEDGDIVNLDVTIFLEGVHGDCSATFPVGNIDEESRRLMRIALECRDLGIAAVKPGGQIRDIGRAIELHARKHGMGTVRAFEGHGIGTKFHSDPQVPHWDDANATTTILPGMTFTVEPMITLGTWQHRSWDDGWTAVTADGKRTAQYEHTILVTEAGTEILTRV